MVSYPSRRGRAEGPWSKIHKFSAPTPTVSPRGPSAGPSRQPSPPAGRPTSSTAPGIGQCASNPDHREVSYSGTLLILSTPTTSRPVSGPHQPFAQSHQWPYSERGHTPQEVHRHCPRATGERLWLELDPGPIFLLTEEISVYSSGQKPREFLKISHPKGGPGAEGTNQPISDHSLEILNRILGSEPSSVQNTLTNFYQLCRK